MQFVLSVLSAGVVACSFVPNRSAGNQGVDGLVGVTLKKTNAAQIIAYDQKNPIEVRSKEENPERTLTGEEVDDVDEGVDFDGFESDGEDSYGLLGTGKVDSLMHVHHKNGEILVPCFGMWWPVGGYYGGGGGGGYEYIDYYGDYKKKRRRSRKQKKAAKMKKKKS